ncbi:MAG: ATP-binding protein [Saprospiraceae bacterium]|nr:ATP-binding protein [Saprospiraceae bacterium]MDW8483574.1 ATP-binding protein [Saprospiraceae bacterium]
MSNLHKSLTLPSNPENVRQVEPLIQDIAHQLNLSREQYDNILLSLTEAVTNAMVHGNQGDSNKRVCISLRHEKNVLSIRVSDEGPGFNPNEIPDPTHPENLEACSGRGIFIMRRLSHECRFTRGGRTVEMRFNLQSSD